MGRMTVRFCWTWKSILLSKYIFSQRERILLRKNWRKRYLLEEVSFWWLEVWKNSCGKEYWEYFFLKMPMQSFWNTWRYDSSLVIARGTKIYLCNLSVYTFALLVCSYPFHEKRQNFHLEPSACLRKGLTVLAGLNWAFSLSFPHLVSECWAMPRQKKRKKVASRIIYGLCQTCSTTQNPL